MRHCVSLLHENTHVGPMLSMDCPQKGMSYATMLNIL